MSVTFDSTTTSTRVTQTFIKGKLMLNKRSMDLCSALNQPTKIYVLLLTNQPTNRIEVKKDKKRNKLTLGMGIQ